MILYGLILLGLLALALLALAYWISGRLLYPPRHPLTCAPTDYGLAYEDVAFPSPDGRLLKGWWIPAGPDGQGPAVVLLHPLFGNRHGFRAGRQSWPRLFRADVELLKTARGFHQAGYTVLMFDFRSHGESQRGLCAGGPAEDQDVAAALDYVFNRLEAAAPDKKPQVGLVGFGLGSAAALVAVGRQRGSDQAYSIYSGDTEGGSGFVRILPPRVKLLRFLVAVQPASLESLLRGYLRGIFAPLGPLLVPLVDWLVRRRGGYPLATGLPKYAAELRLPVLYVQAGAGPWAGEVQQLYETTPGPRQYWRIEERLSRLESYDYLGEHLEPVLAFAAQHLSRPVPPRAEEAAPLAAPG